MRKTAAFAAGLLAACHSAERPASRATSAPPREAPATSTPTPSPTLAGTAIGSADRLVGKYRIAGADGRDINLPYGITASITAERISVTADCTTFGWSYHLSNGILATVRRPDSGCRRTLTPQEQAIAGAFDKATSVTLTPSNGYEFAGGGHSVTLFTQ